MFYLVAELACNDSLISSTLLSTWFELPPSDKGDERIEEKRRKCCTQDEGIVYE
jgi:hypothetical protein